jgi:hypothetical protein
MLTGGPIVPVDAESLSALSHLTSSTAQPWSAAKPGRLPVLRRLLVLGAGSVAAGLLCGLLVPGPAEAGTPQSSAATAATASPGHGAVAAAEVAHVRLLVDGSPFSRSPGATVAPPRAAVATRRAAMAPVADPRSPRGALRAALAAAAVAYHPTRPLPARSGSGRRIVYAERTAHVWVVGADGQVLRDYAVTGRVGRPRPAVYHVYSKSPTTSNPAEGLRFDLMVRFARGITGARIGFHTIPRYADGRAIQSETQLGTAIGAGGCVRQARADATWLYAWSRVGDTVVVLL